MKSTDNKEVFYALCIDDIQTVAEQEIGRELTQEEVSLTKDIIAQKINWYDAIADAIFENVRIRLQ